MVGVFLSDARSGLSLAVWGLLIFWQAVTGLFLAGAAQAGVTSPPAFSTPENTSLKPVAVFGDDDRQDLPEEYSALEGKIGMLYEQSTQTLCTAFCVAKDIVATAAHCLFQHKNGRLPNLSDVTFRLNYGTTQQRTGIYGRRTPYTKHFIAVGTTAFNNEPPLSAPRDWALVKLENPICRFGALKVEPRPVPELIEKSKENKIFQVAYHWDYKHWRLAYSKSCFVDQDYEQIKWQFIKKHFIDNDQLLLHKCDTGGASSGSPILMKPGPGESPVAVAINVGTYTRTRILLRKGEVVKKLNPDIIANTGVNGSAFQHVISQFENAEMIASHENMVKLQTELHARGLYSGEIDGKLGRGTRSAILSFENSLGLPPTGLPTLALLQRFGQERIRPAHMYSNASGPVDQTGTIQQEQEPPRTVVIPNPPRRPKLPKQRPFDPFGLLR
jgi:protease YdgD